MCAESHIPSVLPVARDIDLDRYGSIADVNCDLVERAPVGPTGIGHERPLLVQFVVGAEGETLRDREAG